MHRRKISTPSGFTLLELLVVLAIAGLLVAIIPAVISAAVPGTELKSAAREMGVALREARMNAISRGSAVEVSLVNEPASYVIGDTARRTLPADSTLAVYEFTGSRRSLSKYAEVRAQRHRLQFFPDGSSSGVMVLLSRDDRHYSVQVGWLMGKVTITPETGHVY